MLTTALVNNVKVSISDYKKESGVEPLCPLGHKLMAKKGKKIVHHFAHYPNQNCDSWKSGKMTNWHAQWQRIVLDKANVEVCLDPNGKTIGNSSFHGGNVTTHIKQNENPILSFLPSNILQIPQMTTTFVESHIADIIKPIPNDRPLIVEIQHSSISEDTIKAREAYYKNMIWLFDATPRVVEESKANKICFTDGKVNYLKEKVAYTAVLTCQGINQLQQNPGDEIYSEFLTPLFGAFIIINTRTKYFFDTKTPTYFDTGFGILRLLKKLDKSFALTYFISYNDFFNQRMPPVNRELIESSSWFKNISADTLLRTGILPKPIEVKSVMLARDRVSIKGADLSCLGLNPGLDDWHFGNFYANPKIEKHQLGIYNPRANNDTLMELLAQANSGLIPLPPQNNNNQKVENENLLILRLRKYLGASVVTVIELSNMKGVEIITVYCGKETYGMRDKFKTLGMIYSKAKKGKKDGAYFWIKAKDLENKLNETYN
jgi:hypothetical protein